MCWTGEARGNGANFARCKGERVVLESKQANFVGMGGGSEGRIRTWRNNGGRVWQMCGQHGKFECRVNL